MSRHAARTEVRPDFIVKVRLSGLGFVEAGLPARRTKKAGAWVIPGKEHILFVVFITTEIG